MSTKTLRKRIALVAVSAMGFGLLSTVPASAANVDATSIASVTMAPVRVADGKTLTVNLAFSSFNTVTSDTVTAAALVHARILSGPTNGTIHSSSAYVSSGDLNAIATTGTASTTAGAATVRMAVPLTVTPSVAGTYTLLTWYDATGSATDGPTVTSPQTTVTFTVAGAPSTINLDSTAKSGKAGVTTGGSFGFTLKDAAGLPTYLKTGETLSGTVSDVSPNVSGGTLYVADGSTTDLTNGNATTKSISVAADGTGAITVATTTAGVAQARIVGSGLLTGVVAAVTADYTTVAYVYATALELTTTAGVSNASAATAAPTAPAALSTSSRTGTIYASNSTAKSLAFKVTNSATGTVQYTIAAIDSLTALPTGVTAGTYTVALAAATPFVGTVTVAATAATVGSGYTLSVGTAAGASETYTVIYQAPSVNSSNGYVTVSPTTGNAAKTLRGGSATISATVRDQFGDVFSGANIIWTVTGRNTYTTAGTSNASGVATYTVVDASTSTTSLTDTVVATAAAPTATSYTSSSANSATTALNYVTSVTVTTLTLTNDAATVATFNAPDSSVVLTATAKDAAGVLMSGIPVTFTLPAGGYVAAGTLLTVYTSNVGVATLTIKSTLTGTNTASVNAGGATASSAYTIANVATDGRVVTIDKAALSVSASSAGQVVVTVKDRYGNLVGGAAFSVSYIGTAGRVSAVNGVVAATGTTGATSGTATVDLTSNSSEAGTGVLTVALTSPDASTATLMGNGSAYTTQVKSVTSEITVAVAKSAEVLAVEAAAAAAEATAKANAETAAAAAAAQAAAAAAQAAADKAATDAAIAALKAQLDAAAVKAAADAAAAAAATEAAQAAAVAAADAATDAATEALDAANAATDAANASAEAGDAATAAAQDAADAVAALSTQVSEMISALKKQITALTNLVIKIQKKVKA